jgi:asparagine synthase (glutamine-hydrolysing)
MCGIVGFCDFTKKSSEENLKNMLESLTHRGPDDNGHLYEQSHDYCIGMGHRRLSIIDLSGHARQPMSTSDLSIVYNGEIYNFLEIRQTLERDGYQFESMSDTEVIIKSFIRWGIGAVEHFIGMFAFTILDRKQQKIYIFRDRGGIKPVYYYWNDGILLFASELKAFHRHPLFKKYINQIAVSLYFKYGYIPAPHSIFKNTFKIRQGHYCEIDLKKQTIAEKCYWDAMHFYSLDKFDISFQEAKEQTEKLLSSAFKYRLVSDVPVGVFLSGGYDSSAVAALLQKDSVKKIKTFCIGFHEEEFNEAPYAKKVADFIGTEHMEYYCTKSDFVDIMPLLPEIYDEPFGDSSAIPTILVSRFARNDVTVALSADGGDELFAGYDKYNIMLRNYSAVNGIKTLFGDAGVNIAKVASKIFSACSNNSNYIRKISKLPYLLESKGMADIFEIGNQHLSTQELENLVARDCSKLSHETFFENRNYERPKTILNEILGLDYKTYLPDDILVKVDRATMSVGLEGREPFMDHRILEFVARIPDIYKYDGKIGKYILKSIVHDYVPMELMNRPKQGFGVPAQKWLEEDLDFYLEKYLNKDLIESQGILNWSEISKIKASHIGSPSPSSFTKLWYILCFQMWYERWM